jgi:hypothetical protein
MEGVAKILRYQDKQFSGDGVPDDGVSGRNLPWGSRALKIALDFDTLETQGVAAQLAFDTMRSRRLWYDPTLLEAFAGIRGADRPSETIREVPLRELIPGMVFAEDVRTLSGQMLVAHGQEVTPALAERIRNLSRDGGIHEPVKVTTARSRESVVAPATD